MSPAPPAPTPSQQQQQQPVTVTTEPPKVTQTVDTTFVTAAQTGKQTSDMTAAANVHQPTLAVYSTVTSSYIGEQSYAMNPYQQTVQPAGGVTLTTNASFQASVGSSNLGSMASFHLPTHFRISLICHQLRAIPTSLPLGATLMPLHLLSHPFLPVLFILPLQVASTLSRTLLGIACLLKPDHPIRPCRFLLHPSLHYIADSCRHYHE